jgi:hypothetical protein
MTCTIVECYIRLFVAGGCIDSRSRGRVVDDRLTGCFLALTTSHGNVQAQDESSVLHAYIQALLGKHTTYVS